MIVDQQRWDFRFGMVAATTANFSMGKDPDKSPLEPRDFFPNLPDPFLESMLDDEQEETDPRLLVAMLEAWAQSSPQNSGTN